MKLLNLHFLYYTSSSKVLPESQRNYKHPLLSWCLSNMIVIQLSSSPGKQFGEHKII